ncbi:hypothetical protein [Streptomyces sp. NPDC054958]
MTSALSHRLTESGLIAADDTKVADLRDFTLLGPSTPADDSWTSHPIPPALALDQGVGLDETAAPDRCADLAVTGPLDCLDPVHVAFDDA